MVSLLILLLLLLQFIIFACVQVLAYRFCGRRSAGLRLTILTTATIVLSLVGFRWNGWAGAILLTLMANLFFWASVALAARVLFPLHNTKSWLRAIQVLVAYIFDFHMSSYVIEGGKVSKRINGQLGPRLGSGAVLAGVGSAAVLQTATKFSRVIGPGVHFLRRGERIKTAVDLHTQFRSTLMQAQTKDAVPVEAPVFGLFRVRPPLEQPSNGRDFPFAEQHVYQVVYGREGLKKEDVGYYWDDYVLQVLTSRFREILVRLRLNQIFDPELFDKVPRPVLIALLNAAGRYDFQKLGIELIYAGFGTLKFPVPFQEQVLQQRVSSWGVEWAARAEETLADGQVDEELRLQAARASAQWELVQGLVNGLSSVQELAGIDPADLIIWQLLTAMETMSADPLTQPAISKEMLATMSGIKKWLEGTE